MKASSFLQLLKRKKNKKTTANTQNTPIKSGKGRILIIDDSPSLTQQIKTMLERNGYETSTAGNGKEGLKKVKILKPDAVLLDIVMPDMNGFQVARQITTGASTSHIPVIMVSTKGMPTDKLWAKRQGASDYITKPVTESELMEKLSKHLKK